MHMHKHLRSPVQFPPQAEWSSGYTCSDVHNTITAQLKILSHKATQTPLGKSQAAKEKSLSKVRTLQRCFTIWKEEGVLLWECMKCLTYCSYTCLIQWQFLGKASYHSHWLDLQRGKGLILLHSPDKNRARAQDGMAAGHSAFVF